MTTIRNTLNFFANVMEAARLTSGQNYLSSDRLAEARMMVLKTPSEASTRTPRSNSGVLSSEVRSAA